MNPLTETTGSNEEWLQNSPHSRGIILGSAQPARQCAGVSRAVDGGSLSLLRREAPRSYVEDLFLVACFTTSAVPPRPAAAFPSHTRT
jgi:hypothetical protein